VFSRKRIDQGKDLRLKGTGGSTWGTGRSKKENRSCVEKKKKKQNPIKYSPLSWTKGGAQEKRNQRRCPSLLVLGNEKKKRHREAPSSGVTEAECGQGGLLRNEKKKAKGKGIKTKQSAVGRTP